MSLKTASARTRIVNAGKAASVVAAATMAVAACGGDSDDTAAPAAAASSVADAATAAESAPAGGTESPYVDGEYSAVGSYQSPGGKQEIGVTVTLSNSVITALALDTSGTSGPSADFQGKFESGVTDDGLVVGKSIDELSVSKVSGSSLTSTGFNDAIDQIKTEAAA